MFLHDAITNTEAQTSPFAHWFRGVERVEHFFGILHPRTGVGKFDDHVAALAQRADHKNAAAARLHSIHSVAYQMIENLKQLVRVATNGGEDAAAFQFDADIFPAKIQIAELYRASENGV